MLKSQRIHISIVKELITHFSKSSMKMKEKEYYQTHSLKPAVPYLMPELEEESTTAKKGNYRAISSMNIYAEIFNSLCASNAANH